MHHLCSATLPVSCHSTQNASYKVSVSALIPKKTIPSFLSFSDSLHLTHHQFPPLRLTGFYVHEKFSPRPSTLTIKGQARQFMLLISALWRQRQGDPGGSLPASLGLVVQFQTNERPCLKSRQYSSGWHQGCLPNLLVSFLFLLSLYSWQEEVTFKPRSSWTSFQHRYLAGNAMHYLRLYERFIKGSLRNRVLNHSNGTLRGIWSHGYIWKPCRRTQGIMIYFICLNKLHKLCSATGSLHFMELSQSSSTYMYVHEPNTYLNSFLPLQNSMRHSL